jgi:hypothetical protein
LIPKADISTIFVCSRTSNKGYNLPATIRPSLPQTRRSCTVHITYSKQTDNRKHLWSYRSGQICRIKCSQACLAMYDPTNVSLLCCVGSGSNLAMINGPEPVWALFRSAKYQNTVPAGSLVTTVTELPRPWLCLKAPQCRPSAVQRAGPSFQVWLVCLLFITLWCVWIIQFPIIIFCWR